MSISVPDMMAVGEQPGIDARVDLAVFRGRFYDCLTTRRDAFVRADRCGAVLRRCGSHPRRVVAGTRTPSRPRCPVRRTGLRRNRYRSSAEYHCCRVHPTRPRGRDRVGCRCQCLAASGRPDQSAAVVLPRLRPRPRAGAIDPPAGNTRSLPRSNQAAPRGRWCSTRCACTPTTTRPP